MSYKTDMERCRDYIEAHICGEITPRILAELLGYSFYHFCHVFRICNDMPVGEYLRRRRLQRAAEAIEKGARITDIGLDFGFDTPSGFSKAFRREFGISPSEYRRRMNKQMAYEQKGGVVMKVRMVKKDSFKAVGYSIAPKDGKEVDIIESGAYWMDSDFSSVSREDYAKLAKGGADQIGMWFHPEEESGSLSYFFGPVVDDFDFVPKGMVNVVIPAADYAVFTTEPADLANDKKSFGRAIQKTWKYIFEEWFEKSDYVFDQEKFAFEFYCKENGDMECSHAVADIYIPVKRK